MDAYPISNIETSLDTLRGAVFMSTLDMESGYYQMKLDEHDKHKTAFVRKYGLYTSTPNSRLLSATVPRRLVS